MESEEFGEISIVAVKTIKLLNCEEIWKSRDAIRTYPRPLSFRIKGLRNGTHMCMYPQPRKYRLNHKLCRVALDIKRYT